MATITMNNKNMITIVRALKGDESDNDGCFCAKGSARGGGDGSREGSEARKKVEHVHRMTVWAGVQEMRSKSRLRFWGMRV